MIRSELDAAGVRDPALRQAYGQCRVLNAEHGKTFFLATRLLAPEQRPAVHALYGFARRADDIIDDFDDHVSSEERAERLQRLATQLFNQLVQQQDSGDDPTLRAVVHTARRYGIPWEMFDDFLASMRMDLTVTDYPDRKSLERYMHGSAEVIGLQMLPVLGTVGPREEAAPYAAALGKAFQLTNFLRDVDEDLQRGRVYLPADELAAYRVDRDMLTWCHTNKRTDARVRRALTEQHAATRRVYEFARRGIELLDPRSRPCVASAYTLYSEILDRIENIDFAIFDQRATVGTGVYRQARRAALAVLPVAAVFVVWDAVAIAAHIWRYNPKYVTGIELPANIPIEELLFFIVIPLCGLFTYNAVDTILTYVKKKIRTRSEQST
jgi:15-cis-phytoene synthase